MKIASSQLKQIIREEIEEVQGIPSAEYHRTASKIGRHDPWDDAHGQHGPALPAENQIVADFVNVHIPGWKSKIDDIKKQIEDPNNEIVTNSPGIKQMVRPMQEFLYHLNGMQKNLEQDKPIRRHAMGKPFSNDYVEVPSKQEHETLNHVFKQLAETFAAAASYVSAQHPKATSYQKRNRKQPNYQEAAKHTLSALKHLTGGRDMSSWSGAYKETNPETGLGGGPLKYSPEKDYPTSYPRYIGENLKKIIEEEIKAVLGEGYPEQTQYYTPREVEQYLPKVYDEFGPYIEDGDLTIALKAGSGIHLYKIGDGQFKPTGEISNDTGGLPENVEDIRLALKDIPVPDIDPYLEPDFGYYESIIKEELEAVLGEASPHEYDQTQDQYLNELTPEQRKLYDAYRKNLEQEPETWEQGKALSAEREELEAAGVLDILQALRAIRDKERKNRKPSKPGKNWGMPWGTGDRGTGYAIPGISEKANQFIKEELEATLDEGMFDFITGGSFDEEAFKEAMTDRIHNLYVPGSANSEKNLERQADAALNGGFREWVPDEGNLNTYVKTLREKGPEAAVATVRTYLPHMIMTIKAALRAEGIADILPRKNRKEWEEMSYDFNSVSDGQIKQWMDNNGKIAVQMNEVVASIIAEYFQNAAFGGESSWNAPGAKEKREFMKKFNPKAQQRYKDMMSLYFSAIHGSDLNNRDRSYLRSAFRSSNPVDDLASEFPESFRQELIKAMEETGYDKVTHSGRTSDYKALQSFNVRDIINKFESMKSMFLK